MWESLSPASCRVMHAAESEAQRLGHRYVGDEHLLVALADHGDPCMRPVFATRRLDAVVLRNAIDDLLSDGRLPAPRADEAGLLVDLGLDPAVVRERLEASFGRPAVSAVMHPRAHRTPTRTPWCGPLVLIKRAARLAIELAEGLRHPAVDPAHLVAGVLRDARDPVGTQLSRRGRTELVRVGLRVGAPNPVPLMLARCGVDILGVETEILAALAGLGAP